MPTFRVIIAPRAASDLTRIHEYITRDSVQNADAMVGRILDAPDQPLPLQALEHGRQRGGIHLQRGGNSLDRQRELVRRRGLAVIPECEHHQILRMGQAERLQEGPVHRQDRPVGRRQREAHLAF